MGRVTGKRADSLWLLNDLRQNNTQWSRRLPASSEEQAVMFKDNE